MPGAEEPSATSPERICCSTCGTDQDGAAARERGRCLICSSPLADTADAAAEQPQQLEQPQVLDLSPKGGGTSAASAAAAALPKRDPGHGPLVELDELLAADKRVTSMLALVPLWGPWHLRRSEAHTAQEKVRLTTISILLTLLLVAGVWTILPSDQQKLHATRARVDIQIEALGALVRSYAEQHHELPDDTVWQRSAGSADLRFYDPWGHVYRYQREDDGFTIGTYGRDGIEGGRKQDADVFRHFSSVPPPEAAPAP